MDQQELISKLTLLLLYLTSWEEQGPGPLVRPRGGVHRRQRHGGEPALDPRWQVSAVHGTERR